MSEIPTVHARLRLKGNGRVWRLVGPCPFCGGRHAHSAGLGHDDPSSYLGERTAPCSSGRYRLAPDGGAKGSRINR